MQNNLNEDFIEEYSELFAKKVSDDFFSSKSHISGQEIVTVTPSKQVNFFIIKLLFGNWQEESQRLKSPFFDYSATDVKEAMVQFMNVLSRHIKIERQEFEILLQDAVRDTLFFILAPNVFMEIEMDRKGTETFTEKSAKNLIKYLKIEKEKFAENILKCVGADRDEIELDESIITDEVLEREIAFLNEVAPITRQKLEDEDDLEEDSETSLEVSEPSIEETPSADDVDTTDEEPSGDEPEETESQESEELDDEPEAAKPVHEDEPTTSKEIITNLDPEDEDEDDEDAILNSKFEDPLVGSIAEAHEKLPDSMMSSISLNHRYMFINELFDGEADLFAEALGKVEASNSFDDSVEVLVQNYAKDFHWDMNSDEVKELLKIIFRRFR